ncbi:PIN domain-containing protein [Photorhabdus noenieputensis]|nr:PIN domain-containing protein [Photorhabdus noenieputensis]
MTGAKSCGFIDSNVVLYLLSQDVAHVCVRKLKMSWEEIAEFLDIVRSFCKIVPLTVEVYDRARFIAKRYHLSFYDSCIVATAVIAGCRALYSEDMNHGQMLEDILVIKNPFSYA